MCHIFAVYLTVFLLGFWFRTFTIRLFGKKSIRSKLILCVFYLTIDRPGRETQCNKNELVLSLWFRSDFMILECSFPSTHPNLKKNYWHDVANNRDWSPVIIENGLLAVTPTHFCGFWPDVWLFTHSHAGEAGQHADTLNFAHQTKKFGLVVGRPVSFPLTFGVAQLISERTRLGRRSNAYFCAVFLSAEVWE